MRRKKENIIPAGGPRYDAAAEKKENVVGLRIADARKKKGMSLAVFCGQLRNFGVEITPGGAGKWETGYSIPNAYQLVAICCALDIEDQISFFMKDYVPVLNDAGLKKVSEYRSDLIASGKYSPAPRTAGVIRFVDMPVSTLKVSAGDGAFLDEGNYEIISFPEDKVPAGADFGIRVSGDSMEPVYHDGQIVWVQECGQLAAGQVGIFIYGDEGYLKIYSEQEPDADMAEEYTDSYGVIHPQSILLSYNPLYAPKEVRPDTLFRIVGRVL